MEIIRKGRIIFLVAILLTGMVVFPAISKAYTFSKNLGLGSKGEEVRELQKILNLDPYTRVAATGPGSRGRETVYFGSLTKKALLKFQNKYKKDITGPLGIIYESGNVGNLTRVKLNKLSGNSQIAATATPPLSTPPGSTQTPPAPQTIILPDVNAADFNITASGASSFKEFYEGMINHLPAKQLTPENYQALLKAADNRVFLPRELITKALGDNSFSNIHSSLAVFKDLLQNFKNAARQTPLTDSKINGVEDFIHSVDLPIMLIDKVFALESGTITKSTFNDYYQQYLTTAASLSNKVRGYLSVGNTLRPPSLASGEAGPLSFSKRVKKFIENLGFIKVAEASASYTPFGGKIQSIDYTTCDCSGAELISINDYASNSTYSLINYYASYVTGAVKDFGAVSMNDLTLGNYISSATICLEVDYPYCITSNQDGTITLIGTN